MIENTLPCPVIWALGRKGYMVQSPLLAAVNAKERTLAITSTANIHLSFIKEASQLLFAIDLPNSSASIFKFLLNWLRIEKQLIDLLQCHASIIHVIMCSPWDVFFLNAAKKTRIPLVVTIHDAVQHTGEESYVMDKLRSWCMSQATDIAVLSNHVAQTLKNNHALNKPIHVIDDGLIMRVESALSARIYPSHQPLKLLFHGRIHAYKGLSLLLDAMLLLQNQGHIYPLTIAGAGDLAPYQEKMAQLKDISVHNEFMSDEFLLQTLAEHDICVLPYIEASQSAVAVDALWAALPSIATPIGALPQQFKHGIDALIIESVIAESLATAIHQLSTDKILYEKLSKGAHQSYQDSGPEKAANQWVELYTRIINREASNYDSI